MEWLKQADIRLFNAGVSTFRIKLIQYWKNIVFKLGSCDLCGGANNISQPNNHLTPLLCAFCRQDLALFDQTKVQGDLLNWPKIYQALPHIHFDHLFCAAPYISPFTKWLPQFKYQGRFELAQLFAELIYQQWLTANNNDFSSKPLLLSVPLHITKWQVRGYNQAHLIAKIFAKRLSYHYQPSLIKRLHKNDSQVGQTGAMRRHNLIDAFEVDSLYIFPEHVILIDDVVTTGSTVSEISRLLKLAGVQTVTVVAVCLSLPK